MWVCTTVIGLTCFYGRLSTYLCDRSACFRIVTLIPWLTYCIFFLTVWVGTAAIGLTYFCAPLSTYLCNRFGCRIVACTGSILLAISGFLTSYVGSIFLMYFTYGVLGGLASSLLYFSSLVALIEYFYMYLPTASGVAVSGSGVGTVIITLLLQHLLSTYGLKIAFQALAGMSAICFIAGLAYAPLTSSKERNLKESLNKFPEQNLERVDINNDKKKRKGCLRLFKLGKHWKNKGFVVWAIAMALVMFVCYIPIMYLVSMNYYYYSLLLLLLLLHL